MTTHTESTTRADRELHITRTIDAPREVVFRAWTDPSQLAHWFGPKGCTLLAPQFDVRPGGGYRCGYNFEGSEFWLRGVYREIEPHNRLVFTHGWENEAGDVDHDTLVTVTFTESDGKTSFAFHQAFFDSVANRDSHGEGWGEAFDRLAEHVRGAKARDGRA